MAFIGVDLHTDFDSADKLAEDVRLSPAHEAELARRMETFDRDAGDAAPWETIETEFSRKRQ